MPSRELTVNLLLKEEVKAYLEEEDVVAEISQLGRPKSSDVCDEAARDAVPRAIRL